MVNIVSSYKSTVNVVDSQMTVVDPLILSMTSCVKSSMVEIQGHGTATGRSTDYKDYKEESIARRRSRDRP